MKARDFLPDNEDYINILKEYTILWLRAVVRLIPVFKTLECHIPRYITGEYSTQMIKKTEVIPLEVIFLNEQSYSCSTIQTWFMKDMLKLKWP